MTRAVIDASSTPASRFDDSSACDAACLELAMRLGAPLATRDGRLAVAAQRAGVALVGGAQTS